MKIAEGILRQIKGIRKSQRKFLMILFNTVLSMSGRVNFANLSRYSAYNEKSYSRNFRRFFDFTEFNALAIEHVYDSSHEYILATDASFIPKSGKSTFGLGTFWNGVQSRHMKGLEISNFALIDVTSKTAYSLTVDQVPPSFQNPGESAIDFFLWQLNELAKSQLPIKLPNHIAVDGFYSKQKFVDGSLKVGIDVIGKLRKDANLRYLYQPPKCPKKKPGRPRQYDGKINCKSVDLSRFELEGHLNEQLSLYSCIVYSISLKRKIKLLYLRHTAKSGKITYALLFSTDLNLDAMTIYRYYTARFQIEFIFRDAKQHTGLTHCQARSKESLKFHFNMSLSLLNLARIEHQLEHPNWLNLPFSMASYKRRHANELMLKLFLSKLDIDPNLQKIQNIYHELRNFGVIAA